MADNTFQNRGEKIVFYRFIFDPQFNIAISISNAINNLYRSDFIVS